MLRYTQKYVDYIFVFSLKYYVLFSCLVRFRDKRKGKRRKNATKKRDNCHGLLTAKGQLRQLRQLSPVPDLDSRGRGRKVTRKMTNGQRKAETVTAAGDRKS